MELYERHYGNVYCETNCLQITETEVERIAVKLILDGKLSATIDQEKRILHLEKRREDDDTHVYDTLKRWTRSLSSLQNSLEERLKG